MGLLTNFQFLIFAITFTFYIMCCKAFPIGTDGNQDNYEVSFKDYFNHLEIDI